jgi:hypothetical protein
MNEHKAPESLLNGSARWHAATRRQATRDRIIRAQA